MTCLGARGWQCNYAALANVQVDPSGNLAAVETLCDGIDNNCNGVVDEGSCPTPTPPIEICDGIDNDGDGSVDEGVTPQPGLCAQSGACAGSQPACLGTRGWKCNFGSGVEVDANGNLAPVETFCDGIDNNCNGMTDETFPNLRTPCCGGVFVCSADQRRAVCSVPCP